MFGLAWQAGLVFCATWLMVAAIFRYSSLAALVSVMAVPAAAAYLGMTTQLVYFLLFAAIIILITHQQNIVRLIDGEETRISLRRRETQ